MDSEFHYAHASGFAKSQQQHSLNLGFFSCPTDVAAPDPDYFDSDLDSVSNTPGPLSNITFSNESYDSLSSHSESIYNFPTTHSVYSAYSSPTDITMEFSRFNVDSDYAGAQSNIHMDDADPTSFGTLPPTPPRSPPVSLLAKSDKNYHRGSYSDYSPPDAALGPRPITTHLASLP
ncbi:hypothetical protein BD779DRAFT_8252 [Infundibulicybe gibba]|nr:hypothetical protein BD779DRAFT_8252 [Infundibulicybe gibba]